MTMRPTVTLTRLIVGATAALLLAFPSLSGSALAQTANPNAPGYVVVVDYTAAPSDMPALTTLVLGVARASVLNEPGCRRFDVERPASAPNHLILFEVFDDEAAFAAHAATPHFKQFGAETAKIKATRVASPGSMLLSLQHP
ncbi:putative quinol monooxygenase [Lichenihabitans psoromatis]|uniref:putative quinol monooxygenase n=1 Tax=Lichenihabitans psoromatis TaxID=2528642 RepID=UPI00103836E0|nr:antibiotic biosynthesis monooxygenase [Lichenihabitans psoromatis]